MQILTEGEKVQVQTLIDKLGKLDDEMQELEKQAEKSQKDESREGLIRTSDLRIKQLELCEQAQKVRDELEQLMQFTLRNVGVDLDRLNYFQQIAEFKKIAHI